MRAGWPLFNTEMSKLLPTFCVSIMPQQKPFSYINLIMSKQLAAVSLVQSTQMLRLSVCGNFSIAGHQGLQAHSQVALVIVLCVSCLTTK